MIPVTYLADSIKSIYKPGAPDWWRKKIPNKFEQALDEWEHFIRSESNSIEVANMVVSLMREAILEYRKSGEQGRVKFSETLFLPGKEALNEYMSVSSEACSYCGTKVNIRFERSDSGAAIVACIECVPAKAGAA